MSNKIQINDRIVEVNSRSLQGYSNHEAVDVLRGTGHTVTLSLERYLRGPKYEQLQQAIAASELKLPQPSSPSITSLPSFPISAVSTFLLRFGGHRGMITALNFLTCLIFVSVLWAFYYVTVSNIEAFSRRILATSILKLGSL